MALTPKGTEPQSTQVLIKHKRKRCLLSAAFMFSCYHLPGIVCFDSLSVHLIALLLYSTVGLSFFFCSCTQSPFHFFFRYLFILSLSKFKYCSFSFSILFRSSSLCSSHLHILLLQLSQATVWASSRLSLAPSPSSSLPLFPLSEWRERIPYAPSVAPRFTIARAQNWLEFLAVLEKAGISRRRPRPTWHRMPPFPLTGTPPADTALAESWEQWGPGNLHALLPCPLVYKLLDPDLNSGWDVCKNYGCIFLYLLTLSGSPTTPPPLSVC